MVQVVQIHRAMLTKPTNSEQLSSTLQKKGMSILECFNSDLFKIAFI